MGYNETHMTSRQGAIVNAVKKTVVRTKEFVSDHKVVISVVATATATTAACIAMNRGAVKQWNEFLAERGLTNEFYNTEA